MNLDHFARFFVRFNGVCFLFWALFECLGLPFFYLKYVFTQDITLSEVLLAQDFFIALGRICMQLLAAAILLGRTDKLITFILTGQWRLPAREEQDKG